MPNKIPLSGLRRLEPGKSVKLTASPPTTLSELHKNDQSFNYNSKGDHNMSLSNLNHQDVWGRTGKTFVQAFLGAWAVTSFQFNKGILAAAVAAGVSAVWNYGKELQAQQTK